MANGRGPDRVTIIAIVVLLFAGLYLIFTAMTAEGP